jgi:hypothetical protein
MVGEWIGGVVLVVILSWLVRLTYPKKLVGAPLSEARSGHGLSNIKANGSVFNAPYTTTKMSNS